MKKNIILFLILLMLPFFYEVKASSFNGLANPVTNNSSWGSYCNARFCPWGNGYSFIGVKISLYYINNGNFSQVKTKSGKTIQPVYITSTSISSSSFDNLVVDTELQKILGDRKLAYEKLSQYFATKFGTTTKNNGCTPIYDVEKKKKYFEKLFGVSMQNVDFSNESQEVNCGNNKAERGYRIIMEPLIRVSTSTVNATPRYYFFTVKEIAEEGLNPKIIPYGGGYVWNATSFTFKDMAKLFVTKVNDVGITAYTSETCASFGAAPAAGQMYKPLGAGNVADKTTGC